MDFGTLGGRGSMKRKQSASILQALGKSSGSSGSRTSNPIPPPSSYTPPTASSSHFPLSDPNSPDTSNYSYETSSNSIRTPSTFSVPLHSARSVSGMSVAGSIAGSSAGQSQGQGQGERREKMVIKRPDDVFRVVKDRVFSWSYMMQWYQGDIHWFNTVKVSRSALETSLGPSKVEQRARHMYQLGTSLAPLFDITTVPEFLKSTLKLLEEWEMAGEGGKGMMGLFRGQRSGKKSIGGYDSGVADGEYLLLNAPMPFAPDFFIAHSILCSMVRDVYKKILGMILPPPPSSSTSTSTRQSLPASTIYNATNTHLTNTSSYSSSDPHTLFHPSTIIHSAHITDSTSSSNPLSPSSVVSGSTHDSVNGTNADGQYTGQGAGTGIFSPSSDPVGSNNGGRARATQTQRDAFQSLIAGQLAGDQMLVGEGQKLTPAVVELFVKVDIKFRKHFSALLREGDALAKKVLDDELAMLTASLTSGAPLQFDFDAALHGPGGAGSLNVDSPRADSEWSH